MPDLRTRVNTELAVLREHPRVRLFLPSVERIAQHELVDRAAALTYYGILGIIPALIALYAVLGIVGTDTTVQDALGLFGGVVPGGNGDTTGAREKFASVLESQASSIPLLGLGLLGVLWTASAFVGSFFRASATVWGVKRRPLWQAWPGRVAVTLALVLLVALAAAAIVVTGELAEGLGSLIGLTQEAITLYEILKWPLVLLLLVGVVATLYGTSPHHADRVRVWWYITPGVVFAVLAWLVVSGFFTLYVHLFGSYETSYGALGTTIASMVWLWLTNLVLLAGVTVDAELPRLRSTPG